MHNNLTVPDALLSAHYSYTDKASLLSPKMPLHIPAVVPAVPAAWLPSPAPLHTWHGVPAYPAHAGWEREE